METCRVLNLFKRKAERFWVDWHFQRKVETFRMLEGPPRLSLSLPILEENLLFAKIKSATFSGRGNVDQVIAECWIESRREVEVGKIYDLLFVRVVKMCSVSSFHTKDIKLDSINNRALEQWSDVKSELFFKNDEHDLYEHGIKYSSSI